MPRSVRPDLVRFIQRYMEAADAGLTVKEFCELYNMHPNSVYCQKHRLRRRGIPLPKLGAPEPDSAVACPGVNEEEEVAIWTSPFDVKDAVKDAVSIIDVCAE